MSAYEAQKVSGFCASFQPSVTCLIVIKQAHFHVADTPIPVQVHAREPISQTVFIPSIFFTEHEVHVVFVGHCCSGIRSVLVSSPLRKWPWTHRHDPVRQNTARNVVDCMLPVPMKAKARTHPLYVQHVPPNSKLTSPNFSKPWSQHNPHKSTRGANQKEKSICSRVFELEQMGGR